MTAWPTWLPARPIAPALAPCECPRNCGHVRDAYADASIVSRLDIPAVMRTRCMTDDEIESVALDMERRGLRWR